MEAKAQAEREQGLAEAKILEEKLTAQARGEEQQANAKRSWAWLMPKFWKKNW